MDVVNHDRPYQEAARWLARLQAADCTEQERIAFERWRNESAVHADALARAEKLTAALDQLVATDVRLHALAARAYDTGARGPKTSRVSMRWAIPAALAATLALALAVTFSMQFIRPSVHTMAYDTQGASRTVTLEDGSIIRMDIATRIEVRMSGQQRRIELLSGRALFDVAHDASRPFSVTAAGARTTALGTRFQVEREQSRVLVTLEEGSVAVDDGHVDSGWLERLAPGEQLSFDEHSKTVGRRRVDLQHVTSWSRGRHAFRGTPLAEAIQEINRYSTRKVRLGDPSLAASPVGGNFIAGDSGLIVDAWAAVLPIRVVVGDGNGDEILLFRRYE